MLKSIIDCADGYHVVELDPKDRHKNNYTKHTDAIIEACPYKPETTDRETIIDYMIGFSATMEGQYFRVCSLLSYCNENGMVFNPDKFQFAKEEVEFAGCIRSTDKYVDTILNLPTPWNISDVRSWYVLINQVA